MKQSNQFALRLSKELCIGCGACAGACLYDAIRLVDAYPEIDPDHCRLCGSCVQECPVGALTMEQDTLQTAEPADGIWVLVEVERGKIAAVTKELLGKAVQLAKKLQQPVEALLIGYRVEALAAQLAAAGADRVHMVDDARFTSFIEEEHASVAVKLVKQLHPAILLVGATSGGRAVAARMAAQLRTGLTADCTDLDIDKQNGLLQQVRPAFGGNLMATIITPHHRPQMATVRPGVMKALEPGKASGNVEIVRHDVSHWEMDGRIHLLNETIEEGSDASLANSRIVVGVGRGVKSKETVEAIRQWAKHMGAAVAGSRAAVEAGLIDAQLQVGQTGQTISPDLYIAIGISGQIQHTAGIVGAKKIIAINTDPQAPIFRIADYGWIISAEEALSRLLSNNECS